MFELVAGLIGGFFVKDWLSIFAFAAIVGLVQTIHLPIKVHATKRKMRQAINMEEWESSDDAREAKEGLEMFEQMMPSGVAVYVQQFVWSSVTAFVPCLIVGGVRLIFFT